MQLARNNILFYTKSNSLDTHSTIVLRASCIVPVCSNCCIQLAYEITQSTMVNTKTQFMQDKGPATHPWAVVTSARSVSDIASRYHGNKLGTSTLLVLVKDHCARRRHRCPATPTLVSLSSDSLVL